MQVGPWQPGHAPGESARATEQTPPGAGQGSAEGGAKIKSHHRLEGIGLMQQAMNLHRFVDWICTIGS